MLTLRCCLILVVLPAMADVHAATRARLSQHRHKLPYMSQSTLAAILEEAQREEPPVDVHRDDIRNVRGEVVNTVTPYGTVRTNTIIPAVTRNDLEVEMCAPLPMLYVTAATCRPFCLLLLSTLVAFPNSPATPWNLVVDSDEMTSGNALSYANTRKCRAIEWSFTESGLELSDEESWFLGTVIRVEAVKSVAGYMPSLFAALLK